ncbi:MAG: AMP-binding protein [Proteobacteria bacterium]|nr:AMP-binding protein [Pseudomonadota bacterium]
MLEGVVPFPPEFQARYREKGYWEDKSIAQHLAEAFAANGDRMAVIDETGSLTYAELDAQSTNLALNLIDLGLKPLDRVVVQLPNIKEFATLYIALQKAGCIPIAALVTHRFAEISQFVQLSGAVASVTPGVQPEFDFPAMIRRVQAENGVLAHTIVWGDDADGFSSLEDLIRTPASSNPDRLAEIEIDPDDPTAFQLSGGTTGIPKLIPRTHNDYAFNSKEAAKATEVTRDSRMLIVPPIAHNLPLACPGLQGYLLNGASVVLSTSGRGADVFNLIQTHKVTHVIGVPALHIGWINDPAIGDYDLTSVLMIGSGGQRLQPEVRLRMRECFPNAFVQENFGMAEGTLMFVSREDSEDAQLETVGKPICPDDEVRLLGEDDQEVAFGEVGEFCVRGPYTLRGYYGVPEHNARAFTSDGFYRSGDLMRQHPSGNYMVEGRIKDLINRGGEKISAEEIENLILQHPAVKNIACVPMPDPRLGERMCAYVILHENQAFTLEELNRFLNGKEIAKFKLPERLEILDEFPVSSFGKVSKKDLVAMITTVLEKESA